MFYQNNALKEIYNMKTIEELNASKVPIVIIDKSLDKFDEVVFFSEKGWKGKKNYWQNWTAGQIRAPPLTRLSWILQVQKKPKILA